MRGIQTISSLYIISQVVWIHFTDCVHQSITMTPLQSLGRHPTHTGSGTSCLTKTTLKIRQDRSEQKCDPWSGIHLYAIKKKKISET